MKKIFFVMLAFSMVMASCKSSGGSVKGDNAMENVGRRPMGMWKAMEWTSNDRIEKDKNIVVVDVPAAKNTVELNCTNYNRFWLSSINGKGIAETQRETMSGEFFSIKCLGNQLLVSFEGNAAAERTLDVTIQSGDVFSKIKFVQKAE